jgi:rRNA maturation RNase YbeY
LKNKIFISSDNFFKVNKNEIKKLFNELAEILNFHFKKIEVSFVSDEIISEINVVYLNHQGSTDIITFDYSEDNLIECELIISYQTAIANALKFKVDTNTEIIRLLVHGILHVTGYDDKLLSDKLRMKKKENELVRIFSKTFGVLQK